MELLVTIIYSMAIAVYAMALAITLYYYSISKRIFARHSSLFSLYSMLYAIFSLESAFPSPTPQKNLFDITFLAFSGTMASLYYLKNLEFILDRDNLFFKLYSKVLVLISFSFLVGSASYLMFQIPITLEYSNIIHANNYSQKAFEGINVTFIGKVILTIEMLMALSFCIYSLTHFKEKLKKEKFLKFGLILSTLLIIHDNVLGGTSTFLIAPLMIFGNLPEMFRFLKKIMTSDYVKRVDYSQKLVQAMKDSANARITGQYIHDTSRVLNKLDFIENSKIKIEIRNLLDQKYNFLKNSQLKEKVNIKESVIFALELFEIELSTKKIKTHIINNCNKITVNFNQSDSFIIFSNIIQNYIDHTETKNIYFEIKDAPVEVQIIVFGDNKKFIKKLKPSNQLKNIGQGLKIAKDAAIANNSTLLTFQHGSEPITKLRIFK